MPLDHPAADALELQGVLHALSDVQRLHIVSCLASAPDEARPCGGFGLHLAKSTLTHHFRVLREAGVIEQRCLGTAKLNRLRRGDLDARFPGLLAAVLANVPAPVPSAPEGTALGPLADASAPQPAAV